jgi:hypothetical protein
MVCSGRVLYVVWYGMYICMYVCMYGMYVLYCMVFSSRLYGL